MKRLIISFITSIALMFSFSAFAGELKIGVLDLHKLIEQSAEVKSINKSLEGTFKPRQDAIVQLQKDLEKDMSELKRNAAVLSSTDKSQLEDKIRDKKVALQRKEQDYQQDLASVQNKEMQKFFNKLRNVVNDFAKRGNYDLILQKEAVPYASDAVEITDKILKNLS